MKHFIIRLRQALLACIVFLLAVSPLQAATLIRDAEIEHSLRLFANPIFRAAGLTPENVNLFIVKDPSLNAYVAGGGNVFLHTGLMMESAEPEMLIGVIAHEAGHIAGGHLARGSEQLENAHISTILAYVLGAAAALGGGGAEVGSAVMSAGQQVAQRNFLSFTRMNEQSADQAALHYLDQVGISPRGLLELLQQLRVRETVYRNQIDPYALTHPLSKERVAHIRSHLLQRSEESYRLPEKFRLLHQRMRAKLQGFLQEPQITLNQYPPEDQSLSARYARAVALHRISKREEALQELDKLLTDHPEDPYFLELKGQILSENGQHAEALPYYRQAVRKLPEVPLLRTAYARELMAQAEPDYATALQELKQATLKDPYDRTSWMLLAECYRALGKAGQASLAHAEAALLARQPEAAIRHTQIAQQKLQEASPVALRARDLLAEAQRLRQEQEDRKN